mmetsp:Transcript_1061/g.2357  ORF Transcript_1061/g.2357 Transcript_1061/m.2357 type:complete len:294 (+) Transcript_1061:263-1144(+)|eukprot:CAMPEP_0201129072 /NCGR_PEP_ID=MMETSP0850-20130426/35746_1 /ASSEMBLY_ACC=CAM_ASM_000622 /TAXON_ID=183588 /ORGANISM="Pseudo-nitzschia fraudulenta, Strain WWA7" /LENGTH=293 /DNA_ID=CAMNT_0047398447 /DNA_START=261 /DNA_END=1142 /DNA_ORIENTATION=+
MMRVATIRKAGSFVSKTIPTANKAAAANNGCYYFSTEGGGSSDQRKELEYPRAVSKEEAPFVKPPKETSTEALLPWRGWVERLLKDKMNPKTFDTVKGFFYFWPEDPNNLHQLPYPTDQHVTSKDGKESVAIREISPGSQPFVEIPRDDLDADPYDSGYFKRDTRRRYVDPEFLHPEVEQIKLDMLDETDPEVIEAKKRLAAGPDSSPGNGGVFANGQSETQMGGLRAVMSVTNDDLFTELDKHMPDHLPTPTWAADDEKCKELIQWYKDRGLPVPIGGNFNGVSLKRRIAKW